jgi:16S rRNA (uracil1498-N3)-methyltransferase
MRRFYIERIRAEKGKLTITDPEAGHITRVLRMKPGDRFVIMDAEGTRFQARLESAGRHEVLVTLEKALPAPTSSSADIILCQAVLKSRAMDYVVQKASELGIGRISPFLSERTVIRLNQERLKAKERRWREIARNAAKQSDRITPAEIGPLSPFRDLLAGWRGVDALKVILWEGEHARDLKSLLKGSSPTKRFVGMVGPEGGFSREEIDLAEGAGFITASLGSRILRAETAALTVVAVVQYEWGDLSLSPAEGQ